MNTESPRRRLKPDPMGLPRNGFHVFLFVLCAVNGLALLFGTPTSQALEASLPALGVHAYGLILSVGGISVLVGLYWQGTQVAGLLWKRLGYLGLTFATVIYAVAVLVTIRTPASVLAASTTLAFAGICLAQIRAIDKILRRSRALRKKEKVA